MVEFTSILEPGPYHTAGSDFRPQVCSHRPRKNTKETAISVTPVSVVCVFVCVCVFLH